MGSHRTHRFHRPRSLGTSKISAWGPVISRDNCRLTSERLDVEKRQMNILHDSLETDGLAVAGRLLIKRHFFSLCHLDYCVGGNTYAEEDKASLPRNAQILVHGLGLEERPIIVLELVLELLIQDDIGPVGLMICAISVPSQQGFLLAFGRRTFWTSWYRAKSGCQNPSSKIRTASRTVVPQAAHSLINSCATLASSEIMCHWTIWEKPSLHWRAHKVNTPLQIDIWHLFSHGAQLTEATIAFMSLSL